MKVKISVFLFFITSACFSASLSLSDLEGSFLIYHDMLPIKNVVEIDREGNVSLEEDSPYGKLMCFGKAKLVQTQLVSEVDCENGQSFTQKIDLSGVESFDEFTAPVYSSLYNREFEMIFRRLN